MPDEPVAPEEVEEEEPQIEPPPEDLVVEVPQFLHDLLLYLARISAALLCQAGAISVDHCRALAGIRPFSAGERARLLQQIKWMRDTGMVNLPPSLFDLWYEVNHG